MTNWTLRNLATGSDVVVDDEVVNINSYLTQGIYIVKLAPSTTIPAPTAAAGANNGGSPPAPVVAAGSTDKRGSMTFGSGSAAAAGAQVGVTFGSPQPSYGSVSVTPKNDATQVLGLYVTSATASGFTLACHTAPTSSQANTVYAFDYEFVP